MGCDVTSSPPYILRLRYARSGWGICCRFGCSLPSSLVRVCTGARRSRACLGCLPHVTHSRYDGMWFWHVSECWCLPCLVWCGLPALFWLVCSSSMPHHWSEDCKVWNQIREIELRITWVLHCVTHGYYSDSHTTRSLYNAEVWCHPWAVKYHTRAEEYPNWR